LKVYVKRVGETGCELGWRRANEINPFTITAWNLRPVGKVIGVYRDINKFSWNIG
jgi:hypothetical protein